MSENQSWACRSCTATGHFLLGSTTESWKSHWRGAPPTKLRRECWTTRKFNLEQSNYPKWYQGNLNVAIHINLTCSLLYNPNIHQILSNRTNLILWVQTLTDVWNFTIQGSLHWSYPSAFYSHILMAEVHKTFGFIIFWQIKDCVILPPCLTSGVLLSTSTVCIARYIPTVNAFSSVLLLYTF